MISQRVAEVLDTAERLRRRGEPAAAMSAVEEVLRETPGAPRALLLKSRLLYQNGSLRGALDALREVESLRGSREFAELRLKLEEFEDDQRRRAPFVTESMARLSVEQGYLLEAMAIYRQLFEASPNRGEILDEVARLKVTVEREGSRGADAERVRREVESNDRWLVEHPRGA
jgi:tetratricopeptide (TPR) repeat protein